MSFSDRYHVPKQSHTNLTDHLLALRGVSPDDKETFLRPDWSDNHDPFLMHNMQAVVDRLWQGIQGGDHIVVYADYDADGVPGAVLLTDFFHKIGFTNWSVQIPDRNRDGFGLNQRLIDIITDEHTARQKTNSDQHTLLITIDCGISNQLEVGLLTDAGIDVIVTDHHLPDGDGSEEYLPDCLILDPKQPDCSYPCEHLCGTGVIFKLVQALLSQQPDGYDINPEYSKWLLDMVGIATICDMVPLVGENRIFAIYGLRVLTKSPRPGLKKILELARITQSQITVTDLGFGIGPRINAASRLSDAMIAFRALSNTSDQNTAISAAIELEDLNKSRKLKTAHAAKVAYKSADQQIKDGASVLVIGKPDWQLGIVGLIAGLVANKYDLPTLAWTRIQSDDGTVKYKGSARSGNNCSIHALMTAAQDSGRIADPKSKSTYDTFISFGGHTAAGGFVCDESQIHYLSDRLQPHVADCTNAGVDKPTIDATISLEDIHTSLWDDLRLLQPYGVGNTEPLFLLENLTIDRVRLFGNEEQHLSLYFRDSKNYSHEAIRFSYVDMMTSNDTATDAEDHPTPAAGQTVSLTAQLEQNLFNGASNLRLKIIDLEIHSDIE